LVFWGLAGLWTLAGFYFYLLFFALALEWYHFKIDYFLEITAIEKKSQKCPKCAIIGDVALQEVFWWVCCCF